MRMISFLFMVAIAATAQTNSNIQTFGMAGIAGGQTARISVLNLGGQVQTAQCRVVMVFLDDRGASLKSNAINVLPGLSESLDLADTELELGANGRRQIRAVFFLSPGVLTNQNPPACVVVPTLEIFDRVTGRTSILMVNTTPIPQTPASVIQP